MKIVKNRSIIGFEYFGTNFLVPTGWWLALDSDGKLNAHEKKPQFIVGMIEGDVDTWINDGNIMPIATISEFDLDAELSLVQALEPDHFGVNVIRAVMPNIDKNAPREELILAHQEHQKKKVTNTWDNFFLDILPVLVEAYLGKWHYFNNKRLVKYLHVQIDMRDCNALPFHSRLGQSGHDRLMLNDLYNQKSTEQRPYAKLTYTKLNASQPHFYVEFFNCLEDLKEEFMHLVDMLDFLQKLPLKFNIYVYGLNESIVSDREFNKGLKSIIQNIKQFTGFTPKLIEKENHEVTASN